MQIENKVFIVTGASSGIGKATAIALSNAGGRVALLARRTELVESLSGQLPGSFAITADVTNFDQLKEAIKTVYKHYGQIDGLINNAGQSYAASVEKIDPKIFDEIFHLNVLAPIIAMQTVIPYMRSQGSGSIVNVNSGTSFMVLPEYSVYSASKRALLGFTQTARAELEKDNIIVSEVYPYVTDTNFGNTRRGQTSPDGPPVNYASGDSPEYVAGLILQAIQEGQAQYYAEDVKKRLEQISTV